MTPAAASLRSVVDFTFATLNIWGLPAPLSWPPRRVRFPKIARWLEGKSFDVVAIQELWRTPMRPKSLEKSGLVVPAPNEGNSRLAPATRFDVVGARHVAFGLGGPRVEQWWTSKGWQRTTL